MPWAVFAQLAFWAAVTSFVFVVVPVATVERRGVLGSVAAASRSVAGTAVA